MLVGSVDAMQHRQERDQRLNMHHLTGYLRVVTGPQVASCRGTLMSCEVPRFRLVVSCPKDS